jgi:HPt (histidine-containing phosphotransfer) domain-containing protein
MDNVNVNNNGLKWDVTLLSQHIDIDRLLNIAGGNIGFINMLLDKANDSNMAEIALAKRLEEEGDSHSLAKTIHRLKGAAQTICASDIEECCNLIEKACLVDEDAIKIKSDLLRLETLLFGLNHCLKG